MKYSEIFTFLIEQGILSLALFRPAGLYENIFPFLYINPAKDTEISVDDNLLILAPINRDEDTKPLATSSHNREKPTKHRHHHHHDSQE